MDNFMIDINYGLAKFSTPKYWFENGKIHSNTGATIGYPHRAMSENEAIKLSAIGGIELFLG